MTEEVAEQEHCGVERSKNGEARKYKREGE